MTGHSPYAAVEAFLEPLRAALSCVGTAQFTLTPGAMGATSDTHQWTLNDDVPVDLGGGFLLRASMHFETLDQGASSPRDERFRVTTRGYMYAVLDAEGKELIAAHWHPNSRVSSYTYPHWHVGSIVLSPSGIFLARAHIPSPRISFESMIRWIIQNTNVTPAFADWDERLRRSEIAFDEIKTWR